MTTIKLNPEDVEWVVNSNGNLGVKIGEQFFWLYKGTSLVYSKSIDTDDFPLMWRHVGKREFGESCYPVAVLQGDYKLSENPPYYTRSATRFVGMKQEEVEWKPL